MKFYSKIFISFFILIATAFSICGTWMIAASFQSSYQREIDSNKSKNEMLRASFCNIVNSMPANFFKNHKNAVKEIGASVSSGLDKETELFSVYNAKKEILYSSGQLSLDSSLLDKVDKKHSAYKICKIKGNYYLRTISYMILSADLNSYYIETITDINAIYLQRQEMTRMYHYIIFIILITCLIVSLILSYFLTYRVRALSMSTRDFANGDLNIRALVRGQDEIATLAVDFNRMADKLQEKIAEISDHAKSQEAFTAAFAHELKTPLTSIIGYADLLRSVELSTDETYQALDYIYSQGKRLESLSYKLMDLFVLKKKEITFLPFSTKTLADMICSVTKQSLASKEITLELSLEDSILLGDSELLLSLIVNLIDNAKKASVKGQTIHVTGQCLVDCYQISIRDEGRGIPKEEITNITKPFYMVDKSRSRKEGGAGIGMSLCQEIIRLHHAKWKIDSEVDHGTTITITFPDQNEKIKNQPSHR